MSIFEESETYRPFKYPWAVEATQTHAIGMSWDVNQVDLLDDLRQYNSVGGLSTADVTHEENKATVDALVCLFTEMDKSVAGGYTRLLPYTKNNEIRNLLLTVAGREVVHQRAYALAAETFGFPDSAWLVFKGYKEMTEKIDLMVEDFGDLSQPLNYAKQLCQILLGEGIALFAVFTYFLNLKRFGKLIGFNDINQWSLADEDFHVNCNVRIVQSIMKEDLSESECGELEEFCRDASAKYRDCELHLIDLISGMASQQDLTTADLKLYMHFLREYRLSQLGFRSDKVENPLEWMDWMLSAGKHDNFFEKKVTSYSHTPLEGIVNYDKYLPILERRMYGE